ncbi:hypothetical protein BJ878DRAFT_76181 [Calycina marina]|uniref:DUF7514 domain-containing protein n=1 Tax=Calycina marina TaxID=1763456 RepID=A0A9P8CIS6_9HELO|nr:hypothetical protein BJ878DRAFT_76181 [Calycina marina]
MAYDAYGRAEAPPFNDHNTSPNYSKQYSAEPHTSNDYFKSTSKRAPSIAPQASNMSVPERSDSTSHDVSPELIAAITERVKKELMEHLKQNATSVDEQPKAPPLQRATSIRSSSTESPPTARRVHTPPSPTQASKPNFNAPQYTEPKKSPPESPSGVRFSDRPPPTRPAGGAHTYSAMELSTVDQKWGRLFDSEGNPTQRLGQFLRGIAIYLIEEFAPKKSIVVLPTKMAAFYAKNDLSKEVQPCLSIFRAQSNEQISKLYQDLGCEHHLVQETASSAPVVPALTPLGFSQWMSLHILAYPNEEAKRLEKVVLAMPINADGEMVDGRPERLPKQISRHLLPEKEDLTSKKLIESSIQIFFEDLGTGSRRKASYIDNSAPPLSRQLTSPTEPTVNNRRPVEVHQPKMPSPPAPKSQPIERERNPYSGAPSSSDTSSNEDTSVKRERERQPYTAQPGSGKVYSEGSTFNVGPKVGRANSTSQRKESARAPSETRYSRASSTSNHNYVPPLRSSRRASSPPLKSYSNSTPDIGGFNYGPPPSASASFVPPQLTPSSYGGSPGIPQPPPIDIRDPRRRRSREYRRGEEDPRITSEFNSPRDAERYDRLEQQRQQERGGDVNRPERGYTIAIDPRDISLPNSMQVDPRDPRGAAYDDWYRDPKRSSISYDTEKRH